MALLVLAMIMGAVMNFYERWRLPVPAAAPTPYQPLRLLPTAVPTLEPLALPTAAAQTAARNATTLLAPTAGISANVVQVFLDGVSWDVSRLGLNAGHLQGTAAFGAAGNLVLAGHVEMADGRQGVFASIGELAVGDPITLTKNQQKKQYFVSEIKTVQPDDLSVLYPTPDEQLTLITCSDYSFLQNLYRERLVVVAQRSA
jgi:LPXTG-site transpeptidase (sortase) family protein